MFGLKRKEKPKSQKVKTKRLFRQKGIEFEIDANNKITLKFGNAQHVGARRQQEDSFGYSDLTNAGEISQKGVLAVLADGMGGLSHGKQISEYTVFSMLKMFEQFDYTQPVCPQLENMVQKINREISTNFSKDGKSGAGSTLVAALLYKTKLYWVSVGDSRIYLLRDGFLYQMNEDHDYQNQLLTDCIRGNLEIGEALSDAQKDSLTSYIGNENLPYIDSNKRGFALQKGDTLVLCSDGVYNGITNAKMVELLQEDPQVAAEKIMKSVLSAKINAQDNLTVLIINYS